MAVHLFAQSSGLSLPQISEINTHQSSLNKFTLYKNVYQREVVSGPIDSDSFIVGPGDMFMVDIVTSNLVDQFELIVSVTGDLIIPMVGKINLSGKSLSNAIKLNYKVVEIVVNKYVSWGTPEELRKFTIKDKKI